MDMSGTEQRGSVVEIVTLQYVPLAAVLEYLAAEVWSWRNAARDNKKTRITLVISSSPSATTRSSTSSSQYDRYGMTYVVGTTLLFSGFTAIIAYLACSVTP
ncbi:hypothetical protein GCK32_010205, partial [Trichostrongylus colubriformis]